MIFVKQENFNRETQEKLEMGVDFVNKFYPQNDVFFLADEENKLSMQIENVDNLTWLFDDEILPQTGFSHKDISNFIYLKSLGKVINQQIHGTPIPMIIKPLDNIGDLNILEFLDSVKTSIDEFNQWFKTPLN